MATDFLTTEDGYAWLAGLIEGEGSIMHRRDKNGHLWIGVGLTMTDEDVVRRCQEVAGGRVSGPYVRGAYKPQWRWDLNIQTEVIDLILHLRPIMGERRKAQIDSCVAAYRGKTEVRNSDRTHCPHGHPYAGDNLYVYRGRRFCKTCRKDRAASTRKSKRARE
jgi:hypothetical protein